MFAQLWLPAEPRPASAGCLAPHISAPDNALSLVLSKGTLERDEATANRRRQIEIAAIQDLDKRAACMNAFGNCDAVGHRACGTVPFRQNKDISITEVVYGPFRAEAAA